MPPQQFQGLLDLVDDALDFGTHSAISSANPAGPYPRPALL
jgi:hypothetical protein